MYLKRIEMQGFKSFAAKMGMDFQNGVTGIVGPNGSGKSNVADAVRWVLGEQSAKQLRGGNMQDVIFSGTETRKPLGFASVAISFDNSDKALNIDYDEVTVTRRLYRSGESEYLLNGSACRLRDISELFYDTGIGKEGYSIIGQGQIDKIISEKPEDRRELFDEAVGIVRFKRRKNAALKKLESEEQNLLRVSDVLTELSRQVGPLEKQAEKARVYLAKKEELKKADLAVFSINDEKNKELIVKTKGDLDIVTSELDGVNTEAARTKEEYERVSDELHELEVRGDEVRQRISDSELKKQQLNSEIGLLREQINSAARNRGVYEERKNAVEEEKKGKEETLSKLEGNIKELDALIDEADSRVLDAHKALADSQQLLDEAAAAANENKDSLIKLLELRSEIHGDIQKHKTLVEQMRVREGRLAAEILAAKTSIASLSDELKRTGEEQEKLTEDIEKKEGESALYEDELAGIKKKLFDANTELEQKQLDHNRAVSMLESLSNIAERYEGYGNSVRKIMERREDTKGILGVVAELIRTDKKYETAIETALGANLQNIVTDNEETAKELIEYLKRGKHGRATFLPLTSMNTGISEYEPLDEPGFVGIASNLVKCDAKYKGMVSKLLGRTYVIDNADDAIAIGRRLGHKYRMVTYDGELFNAGGAISGGAYKNSSNLLGRKRQIEELEKSVEAAALSVAASEEVIRATKERRNEIRDAQSALTDCLKSLYLEKNTKVVRVKVLKEQITALEDETEERARDISELKAKLSEEDKTGKDINSRLEDSTNRERLIDETIKDDAEKIEGLNMVLLEKQKDLEDARIELNALTQKKEFASAGAQNAREEIERLQSEAESLAWELEKDAGAVSEKNKTINEIIEAIGDTKEQVEGARKDLGEILAQREALSAMNREFITKRDDLTERRSLLEKESYRLTTLLEKATADREAAVAYLFEEYGLTPLSLPKVEGETRSPKELNEDIKNLRREIKELGNVNVNAVEEYRETRERFDFLSAQYEDIVKAAENLKGIIAELDRGMKKQFSERFADIQKEFNTVFRQLFGGGKGTLELEEGENLLETGVTINAQPPGKKLQNIMQLSGGEKALTAISLLFAIQNLKPSPFCLLDEIEATLDESNVTRFAKYLRRLCGNTQFIVITHRRGTMMAADRLYGITMQEKGISTLVSVDLVEGDLD